MTSRPDAATAADPDEDTHPNLVGTAGAAVVIGAVLAWAARAGALQLLVAVALAQALLGFAWFFVLRTPGRTGGLVIGGAAAAATDVAASVWPYSRLAAMTAVVGLAVPAMFVHQLTRGAGRVRVLASFGGIALLVLTEAGLPALLQLRHEFAAVTIEGDAALAVVVAITGALLAGCFADLAFPVLRFDTDVPRGLVGVVVSAAVGAALGHLVLRDAAGFASGRGAFVGAAVGVCAGLLAVAVGYLDVVTPPSTTGRARRMRPLLPVLVPLALTAPVALLLCLAIRS